MKLIFPVLFLLIPHLTNGQWVWAPLDSGQLTASGYWDEMPGYYWELNSSRMMVSEASESVDSQGALRFSYRIFPVNSWGDYAPVRHTVRPSFNPVSGYDLSNSRYLSFWIKNTQPGKLTAPGKLVFDFSLLTLNGTGFTPEWYRFSTDFPADTLSWIQILQPMEKSFWTRISPAAPDLDLTRVAGFELAAVYYPDSPASLQDSACGEFFLDKIQILGQKFEPVLSFDDPPVFAAGPVHPGAWKIDNSFSVPDPLTLASETADTAEGTGAVRISLTLPDDPGKSVSMEYEFPEPVHFSLGKDTHYSELDLFFRNLLPADTSGMEFTLELTERRSGADRTWQTRPTLPLTRETCWLPVRIPLIPAAGFAEDGSTLNPGLTPVGFWPVGPLKLDSLTHVKMQFSRKPGAAGLLKSEFLLDLLTGSGLAILDTLPPEKPGISVFTSGRYNTLLFDGDPAEPGETLDIYWKESGSPVNDPPASLDGYNLIASGLPATDETFLHDLRNPFKIQSTFSSYAVVPRDRWGNSDPANFSLSDPVLNEPVPAGYFLNSGPSAWNLDGSLSEWPVSGPGFSMKKSDGSGNLLNQVDSDADLSVRFFGAFSKDSLYLTLEVTDDQVNGDSSHVSQDQDAVRLSLLFSELDYVDFSLPAGTGKPVYTFFLQRGRVFQLLPEEIRLPVSRYIWKETGQGYVIEWVLPETGLKPYGMGPAVDFDPDLVKGIQIDLLVQDQDQPGKAEGGLRYSFSYEFGEGQKSLCPVRVSEYIPLAAGPEPKPVTFKVGNAYPNPFNPETRIPVFVPGAGYLTWEVYDLAGRRISVRENWCLPGENKVILHLDQQPTGLYFVRFSFGGQSTVSKLLLLK